jgi:predicted TPR repeat methyltransferase
LQFWTGLALLKLGRNEEAVGFLERALAIDPDADAARHFLNAARGEASETAPRAYVTNLFDEYASSFEEVLVSKLGYSAPLRMRQLVAESGALPEVVETAIDLGCGTGLCGAQFRGACRHLVGVDLSPRMLEMAAEKQIYDELHQGDLVEVLGNQSGEFDFFLCADTLVYIGDLYPVFQAVARRCRRNALFVFSTESATAGDFELRASGRYAHTSAYVERVSAATGFESIRYAEMACRKEFGRDMMAGYYLLKFTGSGACATAPDRTLP